MRRSITLNLLLLVTAATTGALAQTPAFSPTPAPSVATLRSVLLSELHSTHDKAEWFTPVDTALAGLTAEQAKWIPQNAQSKHDANANHSVGMLAYHLVFWNENALARLHGESQKPPLPTMRLSTTLMPLIGPTSCSGSIAS